MPSVSKKQHNLMAMVAHNPAKAKALKIPQAVGLDFMTADKGKKFKGGGMAKSDMKEDTKMDKAQDKAMIKKAFKQHDAQEHKGGKGTKLALKKGGTAKCYAGGGMIDDEEAFGRAGMKAGIASYDRYGAPTPRDDYEYSDAMAKMKRLGVKPNSSDYRLGMKTLTRGTARKELEDLIPSRARSYDEMTGMKKGGRIAAKGEHSVQKRSKRGAEMVKMARGGGVEIRGKTRGKMC
jgi:hypothetical protein